MTAKQVIEEKILTIKWLMQDDKIVKFEEDKDNTYDISDAVAAFDFKRGGVDKGSKVKVKIDKAQGDHGTVVYMSKADSNSSPAQEPKQNPEPEGTKSNEPSTDNTGTVLTIKAISEKNNGITFVEEDGKWYTINLELLKTAGAVKGSKVQVTIEPPKGKGNSVITSVKKLADPEKKQWAGKGGNSYGAGNAERQDSIEAQAAVKAAYTLAGDIFGKADIKLALEKQEDIKKFIQNHSEAAYALIQSLKVKK